MTLRPDLTLSNGDKALTLLVWGVSIALFWSVGWMAMQPDDPQGLVSLWTRRNAVLMVIQIAALASAAAAIGTLAVGARLPDAGVFAAGLGLGFANLRGSTTSAAMISSSDSATASHWGALLAMETVVWFGILLMTTGVSAVIYRWRWPRSMDPSGAASAYDTFDSMAASEWWPSPPGTSKKPNGLAERLMGLKQLLITASIGWIGIRILSAGSPAGAIHHGQSYFAVGASIFFGFWVAFKFFPTRTAFWGYCAAALLAIGAFAYSWVQEGSVLKPGFPSPIPSSVYLRASPITYISVGSACVLTAFWSRRIAYADESHPAPMAPR